MTDKQVLQRAVRKAILHGYKPTYEGHAKACPPSLLFNHSFAKAFWSEEEGLFGWPDASDGNYKGKEWQKHLMLMVLEENPLDYLRKFVEEKQDK